MYELSCGDFHKLTNPDQALHIQISNTEFHPHRTTNVESTDINSFTAVSAVGVHSGAAA